MSYPQPPPVATTAPGSSAAEAAIRALLGDLAGRKEFRAFNTGAGAGPRADTGRHAWEGFTPDAPAVSRLFLPGLRLSGAQLFIRNFENPDTAYTRVLVKWQTGTGKSIAAISIGQEFIRQYRARAALGERAPTVFIIGFTTRETIQEDMLRYPEFGFVSQAEVEEVRRLRALAGATGAASPEARQLASFVGSLRRRITDRGRGGYFQFYGYKEFASRLFIVTQQGLMRGFDVQALYSRAEGAFSQQLIEAVKRGDVIVNEDLLAGLRGGLLIADEIHNVYNILEKNNYGIAIQYALDVLGADAPRAVYMSATPMTGSAAEVVDLLNLLVPRSALPGGIPLRRSDFFTRAALPAESREEDERDAEGVAEGEREEGPGGETTAFAASQLREGSLERIAHLAAGRVSFLLDADVNSYPRRLFVGEEVAGVPYLRLTPCPMAPFHARTLAHEQGPAPAGGLAANAYTLYDIAFPNPQFAADAAGDSAGASYGLYLSSETPALLSRAPEAWSTAVGVIVEKGVASGVQTITGAFLGPERLQLYSTKYAQIVAATVEAVRSGPGKVMIYHHRVRMSGVLLLQEALRMNGFADETSAPTGTTLCAVCGVARAAHGASPLHPYAPARFVVAHSDVDRAVMVRSIARYNAPTNLQGHQYRVLIGSKIVREGLNFRAVRRQLIASLPTDFPTLVQVFGRAVRKDSHADLPAGERDVRISIFVSTRADGRPSPELQRYIDKGREYLVIQEVERALHAYAVDGFANYERIRVALHAGPGGELRAGLDALPYSPVVGPADTAARPSHTATFLAYGHGEREVAVLAAICRVLFRARPVWTYEDLWAAVRAGAVRGAGYDPAVFDEGNFALALQNLRRPSGAPPATIVQAGRFYVATPAGPDPEGPPELDVETYLRHEPIPARVTVRVADYLREVRSGPNWGIRLRAFERAYLSPGAPSTPEMSLVEYGAAFHYTLLRRLIVAESVAPVDDTRVRASESVTVDDARVRAVYRRFRIVITVADAAVPAAAHVYRGSREKDPDALIGYISHEAVNLYDGAKWYSASHADFGIKRRHRENDIVVGFVVSPEAADGPNGEGFASSEARFKLRPPIQNLRAGASEERAGAKRGDVRSLIRGAVCETRPRFELEAYARRLREAVARAGLLRGGDGFYEGGSAHALAARLDYAARFDRPTQKRPPGASELCAAIRLRLLALEEDARAPVDGMASGLRWLYLFCDKPPSVSALLGGSR